MNFRKINNITGWLVFLIALATYVLTREARGSLWDCGEFVSCAYKQQMPHPPGAPLFVMLGRFFIVLFGNSPLKAANAVNLMSALASAATILFLFWTVTHFARKMFVKVGEEMTGQQIFSVMAAGTVGALAYTFSDSFWYSAVEGEVYALSSFFTAIAFWIMLKWEHADEKAGNDEAGKRRADRWIVFLFFMLGLSIGVHLLGLLTIPAVVMIYYFRRYRDQKFSNTAFTIAYILTLFATVFLPAILLYGYFKKHKNAFTGIVFAFFTGCAITGLVQLGIIQYSMKSAGLFDVFFTNSLGMPFFSGFAIYFLALAAVLAWALFFTEKTISRTKLITWFIVFLALFTLPFFTTTGSTGVQIVKFLLIAGIGFLIGYFFKPTALKTLKLVLWSFVFMMVGYLMYITVLIRSNANPAIDMNDVDNPMSLVYYLSREQYGNAPLIYGPHFAATFNDIDRDNPYIYGEMQYVQSDKKYIPIGKKIEYRYNSDVKQFFPRVWDPSNDQYHADFYADWLNIPAITDPQTGQKIGYEAPTYGDNIRWFVEYQLGYMYWRYFMWNFAGKQNDNQGFGNKRDGNWITGIPMIDNKRLGDQSQMPDSLNRNKAHNTLFLLPFLLGIIGCVYQFLKNKRDWIVTFLLFFFTGIAIVLYLNQPGMQPRERDYAYAGSFYAYAIWIGLGLVAFVKMAREKEDKKTFNDAILYGSVLTLLIAIMSGLPKGGGDILLSSLMITLVYAIFTGGITAIIRALSSAGKNIKMANIVASIICLIAPLIMAQQEWDDHDRSKKTTAPDSAKNYLESCAPNAILFTFGDNDTYPLWYAQEVEGVRPDIRIINNSLLGIDWYINQLRYKINNADSLDVIWTPEQIEGHNREYLRYDPNGGDKPNQYYNLYNIMKNEVGKPNLDPDTKRDVGPSAFPVSHVFVPVDTVLVRKNGTVNAGDSVVERVAFEIPQNTLRGIQRNDLMILNIIASNAWKRPIYFTSVYGALGFSQYLRKDGKSYRLVPVLNKNPQNNWVLEQQLQAFRFGSSSVRDNNNEVVYNNLMKFEFCGADKKDVYFDEENRRQLLEIRSSFAEAAGNLADIGEKDKAKQLLERCDKAMGNDNFPYVIASRYNGHNQISLEFLEACYKAGDTTLAEKLRLALHKDLDQQKKYYEYTKNEKPDIFSSWYERTEYPVNGIMLEVLDAIERKYAPWVVKPTTANGNLNGLNTNPGIIDTTKPKDSSPPKDNTSIKPDTNHK